MMTDRIYHLIMQEYALQREKNADEEDARIRKTAAVCPEIHTLLTQRHQMILQAARTFFSAGSDDPEKKMAEYNARIRSLLVQSGFPEDYLQPVCQCEACRDTGYISKNPTVFCDCYTEKYERLSGGQNNAAGSGQTFESFDANVFPDTPKLLSGRSQREMMLGYRDRCLRYAEELPHPARPLLVMTGSSGLGKTFLMNCIADRARKKHLHTVCVSAYRLLNDLKNAYFDNTDNRARDYFDCDVLLLDDLGMEPLMQNITVEQIYNLLNERLVSSLPTVITTNLTMADIKERYTERVYSRFSDTRLCRVLPFAGTDVRGIRT